MKKFVTIKNKLKKFKKKIYISGDKSISIRCVLLASQAIGVSKIYNLLESEDIFNTLKSVKKLGIKVKKKKNYYEISGLGLNGYKARKGLTLNAGNSGTFARLILGLLVNINEEVKLIGDKSLSNRDFSRITEPLKLFGTRATTFKNKLPVKIRGAEYLRPIDYHEKIGSAQCKSAVMLAALKTPGITKIKAKRSRNHTELLFKNLGIPIKTEIKNNYDYIEVRGLHNFKGFSYKIPGDISSCSFFLVLTILSDDSELIIRNVNINFTRNGIIKILNLMNANISISNKKKYKGELIADLKIKSRKNLKSINCPAKYNTTAIDEFLVIFLIAAKAKGTSTFKNLEELNQKESPRLDIAIKFLKEIGIKVSRNKNDIKIVGNPNLNLKGKYIIKNFRKDHRVFMMSCIAAFSFGGYWKIYNPESVNTSFPNFFKIIDQLGKKLI
ncbi:3-phosphoshikimate 1-carboxyvinyltransferase [Pelagibacteraceae bacterium GOM-A4]|nr:3-phosphoshikimate 1-carboxyvinyltransferase [Pelagibacteraceae bacterium GOM-A4]